MISPRVLLYGYGWLDTAVHEYVHYLVTIRTRNKAPVWLQEGLAKLLETRWRSPPPRCRSSPARASCWPAASPATTSSPSTRCTRRSPCCPRRSAPPSPTRRSRPCSSCCARSAGRPASTLLLDRVAAGEGAEDALASRVGRQLRQRSTTTGRRPCAAAPPARPATPRCASCSSSTRPRPRGRRARRPLAARRHILPSRRRQSPPARAPRRAADAARPPRPAARQYEKARAAEPRVAADPKLARRLGELYLQLGQPARAAPLLRLAGLDDPEQANVAAAEGRALLQTGDRVGARAALTRASASTPSSPRCTAISPASPTTPTSAAASRRCVASEPVPRARSPTFPEAARAPSLPVPTCQARKHSAATTPRARAA
jgi:hypothetical protein